MKLTTNILGSLRTAVLSILICCIGYTMVIWIIGQVFVPNTANGSLIQNATGQYVGSRQIAQKFTQDKYFHSRPSAAGYNGTGAAGSNLSPTSPKLTERAQKLIRKYGASETNPIPADMVTASGSGLDPHISLDAARFQAKRIARARNMSENEVMKIVESLVEYPGGVMGKEAIVNVLMLNLTLDERK